MSPFDFDMITIEMKAKRNLLATASEFFPFQAEAALHLLPLLLLQRTNHNSFERPASAFLSVLLDCGLKQLESFVNSLITDNF